VKGVRILFAHPPLKCANPPGGVGGLSALCSKIAATLAQSMRQSLRTSKSLGERDSV